MMCEQTDNMKKTLDLLPWKDVDDLADLNLNIRAHHCKKSKEDLYLIKLRQSLLLVDILVNKNLILKILKRIAMQKGNNLKRLWSIIELSIES